MVTGPIIRFRRQHQELLRLAMVLRECLDEDSLAQDASVARSVMSILGGKARFVFAIEDAVFLPEMARVDSAVVQGVVRQLRAECGGLQATLDRYLTDWHSTPVIQRSPATYIQDTDRMLRALCYRISKEDAVLFPAIDTHANAYVADHSDDDELCLAELDEMQSTSWDVVDHVVSACPEPLVEWSAVLASVN